MSRLQKKCLIGSAGFHLLLVVILLVGPAFLSSRAPRDDSQVITMVDLSKLTDGPTITGGTPSAPPPAALQQLEAPTPPPTPPPVEPPAPPERTFIQKIFEPDPPKEKETEKIEKESVEPAKQKVKIKPPEENPDASKKSTIEVAKKTVKKNLASSKTSKSTSTSQADAKAQQLAAQRARAAAVSRALGKLEGGLSSGTEVSIPGPGAGTFVNYGEAVRIAYTEAWIPPTEAADDSATAKVSVTIARDGTVISARVKTPSGSAAVDRSVEQTLRRVKFIAPFPEGATDAERTFIINFNLKAKRLLG